MVPHGDRPAPSVRGRSPVGEEAFCLAAAASWEVTRQQSSRWGSSRDAGLGPPLPWGPCSAPPAARGDPVSVPPSSQNIQKILGLAPSRAATKQAGGFLGPPPPSGKFS